MLVRMWGKRTLIHCWWETLIHYGKQFLKKLKIEPLHDVVIPHLGIDPKECRLRYNKDTYTPMFIIALFTITKL
jgi:hypothetical protein